jgi:hypothetical protein
VPNLKLWHATCSPFPADVSQSLPPQAGRSVAVGLFAQEAQARQAIETLRGEGISEQQVGVLTPSLGAGDLQAQLVTMGVPDGESRYYADQVRAGQTLVVVDADGKYGATRDVLLRHGARDVQSQGAELARPEGAGVSTGAGARPIDVTGRWDDVRSRYEMLFGQHYGSTDATWEQMEPIYRYAWAAANDARHRGKPWAQVEDQLRQDWHGSIAWDSVKGPVRDVWEDVADEATTGAEGGQDRRIPRQGTDQVGPARDVVPPSKPIK